MNPTFELLNGRFAETLLDLNVAQTQLRLRDHPEKWTIQQTVEHLLLTYDATAAAFVARIAKGSATTVRPSASDRIKQFVVLSIGYMPQGQTSPPLAVPRADHPPVTGAQLCGLASGKLAHLDEVLGRAEHLFGNVRVMKHLALGPLTLQQWRKFQLVHGLHHLKQVQAIRRDYGL